MFLIGLLFVHIFSASFVNPNVNTHMVTLNWKAGFKMTKCIYITTTNVAEITGQTLLQSLIKRVYTRLLAQNPQSAYLSVYIGMNKAKESHSNIAVGSSRI